MNDLFRMINSVNEVYQRTLNEMQTESISIEAELAAMERTNEINQYVEEMRRLSNRREKVDDEGNIIPNEETYGETWMPLRFRSNEETSWVCDKCMAINFGCQTACPECGDIKDANDERLK